MSRRGRVIVSDDDDDDDDDDKVGRPFIKAHVKLKLHYRRCGVLAPPKKEIQNMHSSSCRILRVAINIVAHCGQQQRTHIMAVGILQPAIITAPPSVHHAT